MTKPHEILDNRLFILALSTVIGMFAILIMSLLPDSATIILLDRRSTFFPFPFTIQSLMWLVFFIGLGECFIRYRAIQKEVGHIQGNYLELSKPRLKTNDITAIHLKMQIMSNGTAYLPRLIYRVSQTLLMSSSIDSATANLNANADLYAHTIDIRYTVIRYLTWLIPTLGFLGTCIGIALALNFAAGADMEDPNLLSKLSANLGVAFYTTFLALLQSAVLVLFMNILQAKEEIGLNVAQQYCLDNLIGRYQKP